MNVITLTPAETIKNIEKLINQTDFYPDIVIGVLNGAKVILEQFKKSEKFVTSQFVEVKLQRKTEKSKSNKFVLSVFKILPYAILDKLRMIESKKVKSSITNIDFAMLDNLSFLLDHFPDIDVKRILIIDDAVDSGKTMYILRKQLNEKYPHAEIKSAVIAWTIEQSIVKPDYYLYKNILVRYPWSKDFKH